MTISHAVIGAELRVIPVDNSPGFRITIEDLSGDTTTGPDDEVALREALAAFLDEYHTHHPIGSLTAYRLRVVGEDSEWSWAPPE